MVFVTAGVVTGYFMAKHYGTKKQEKFLENASQPSKEERRRIQILSMRISQTYCRDERNAVRDPSVVKENPFWTRMKNCGVSEEEECTVGLAHYLRRDNHPEPGVAPRLIIACRGTIKSIQDVVDDIRVGFAILHKSPRYQKIEELILKLLKHFRANYGGNDPSDIWITGHSLGADIALTVGIKLAAEHMKVSVCCFNGPLLTVLSVIQTVLLIKEVKNTLWNVKEILGELGGIIKPITDVHLYLVDSVKLACAYLSDHEELISQLNQFKALQMGPVLMCVNRDDRICKEFFKFYRRNHLKGRIHLSTEALLSKLAWKADPMYFRMPPRVTMFLSVEKSNTHKHRQWFSHDTEIKKIEFNLDGSFSS